MGADFHFFTDTNLLTVQSAAQAFGPVTSSIPNTDEYRVTSLHTASSNPTAYAACDAIICVQRVNATLVNIVLKPLVQPALNFAPVKYIIYKGILANSLINGADVASPGNNDLTKSIWKSQALKNASALTIASPPANALGLGLTPASGADLADTDPIDNLFYRTGVAFQLPVVRSGWSLGQFGAAGFGMEVLMEGLNFHHPLSLARESVHKISVASLLGGETDAKKFEHWHDKEQVLGFMDPCAFYGSFFVAGIQAKTSGNTPFILKVGNDLYQDVLFMFANKNTAYLDIRNEHNFSLNYFKNYGNLIKLGSSGAPVDYYASKWPILTLSATDFPVTNTTARNVFSIQLPVGDNQQPLVYVSQGYRDINAKGDEFPAELTSAERFYDTFEAPVGGYTATKGTSALNSLAFVLPNVIGQIATTPVSCYIRLKYCKQQQGATAAPTVVASANYLDNLVYPLDLRILFRGANAVKTAVYEEEIYLNGQSVPELKFDFIGKIGIARDADNTTLFLIPTSIHKNASQASVPVTVSSQTSDAESSSLNLIAAQYPLERVRKSNLALSPSDTVPIVELVADGDAAGFTIPDFRMLIVIAVTNATYDSWQGKAAAVFDSRFRVYLGVTNLRRQTDSVGAGYTSFELVLRGFVLDASTHNYKIEEVKTDPVVMTDNVKVYAPIELKEFAITSLSLLDITNQALRCLSGAPHAYFGGNTRIHGTVTVEGGALDTVQSVVLEVVQGGNVVATGDLAPACAVTLLAPFGAAEKVEITQPQLLFTIPSAQLGGIDSSVDGTLTLRVRVRLSNGEETTRDAQVAQILSRYTGANRYGGRDEALGGDDWVRPSVNVLLEQVPNVDYGDMSNMNGGSFPPHGSHLDGFDVDGWYAGYNARDAATAQTMIGHLNSAYGTHVSLVFVAYTESAADTFFQAIQGVVLNDGRSATNVIRPDAAHTTHFHWRFGR